MLSQIPRGHHVSTLIDNHCISCNRSLPLGSEARACFMRRPTLLPENSPNVWRLSRTMPVTFHRLCRGKRCAPYIQKPTLPSFEGVDFEDSIYHRGTARFLDGPLTDRPFPMRKQTFFAEPRSLEMRRFLSGEEDFQVYCGQVDAEGLRCVGCWSPQSEIDAVYHYARLFAQENAKESGIWMPYWFRDARLIGPNRVAYLIKGATSFHGVAMMDTLQHATLSWVWLTPRLRGRGIFWHVWKKLEAYHAGFKVLAPLSPVMRAFLGRADETGAHEVVEETGVEAS